MIFLKLATGIIFVLLGMRDLRKGLDRLFGNRLVRWLQRMTISRPKAFLAGAAVGVVAPSSSAIAMLSVQMLHQSALNAERMLAVVLGANVGITVSVQLLALRLQDYAGVFLVVGGLAYLYLKRTPLRGFGQAMLGLGFIFLAMQWIGAAGQEAAKDADLNTAFALLGHHPWLMVAGVALLTLLLQSSTAAIGLGLGLAQSGALGAVAIVPWVLGANLGTSITMALAGWSNLEGRKLAMANLVAKAVGVLTLLLLGGPVADFLLRLSPGTVGRQAANLHTGFNLVLGLLTLPLVPRLTQLIQHLCEPSDLGEAAEAATFLDPLLLQTPSLALSQAAREELRMLDELELMLRNVWVILWGRNVRLVARVEERHQRIEAIEDGLKGYLAQVSDENLSPQDTDWKFIVLDYAQELVTVGTLIKRDLTDGALRYVQANLALSDADRQEFESFYARTLARFGEAAGVLMSREVTRAMALIRGKEEINNSFRTFRRTRLTSQLARNPGETTFLDIMVCLRRINSHLTGIGYALARQASEGTMALPVLVGPSDDWRGDERPTAGGSVSQGHA